MSALNILSQNVAEAVAAPPQPENLPPVSTSMADVSARLTALEDAVAELKKAVFPSPASGPVTIKNILPSASAENSQQGGKRKRRSRKAAKKTRSRK